MNLAQFAVACRLTDRPLPEVVALVAFYRLRTHGITEFTIEDAAKWLLEVHLSADVDR